MPLKCTIILCQRLLLLCALVLPLPVLAVEAFTASKAAQLNGLVLGLAYGGLGVLLIHNLSLFFTQICKSALVFLCYILCIFIWLSSGVVQNIEQPFTVLYSINEHVLANDFILLIPFVSGLFLMRFTEQDLSALNKSNSPYILVLAIILISSISLTFSSMSLDNKTIAIILLLGCSSLAFAVLSYQQITKPSSPVILCQIGFILLFVYSLYLGINQFNNPAPLQLLSNPTALVFLLQAIFFKAALNYKRQQLLVNQIHAVNDDLKTKLDVIHEQNVSLNIARKEAIKASNVKSRFLANISHEIRTPLNAILGFTQELQGTTRPEDSSEQINLINISAKNLSSLVNDVLDLSKIEAGKFKITEQEYTPLEFFEDIIELNAKSAQMKHLEFNFQLDNLPSKLQGDFLRLKQVIFNLLSNALKFTDVGHISLSVVSNVLHNEMVELIIKVEDTGFGISAKNTKKLFSVFSQVDDDINREYQGSGLGLAISQDIIKMMKGSINVVSEERIGTSFTVKVQQKIVEPTGIYDKPSTFKNKRVLLIDPKPESRRNTAFLLKQIGMITTCVETRDFLDFLSVNDALPNFDFCFLSLPQDKALERAQFLEQLAALKIKKIILMYSGTKPLEHFERFSSIVSKQIALPLTLSKLPKFIQQQDPQ